MLYSLILLIHSWLRWLALIAAVGTLASLFTDKSTAGADRWGFILTIALDLQMMLGLLLYFALSPFTTAALRDMGAAMRNPPLRFFVVDHIAMMVTAVVLVHVGRVLARKAATVDAKRTRLLICVGLALLLMLGGMPWPGMPAGRPLFRFAL